MNNTILIIIYLIIILYLAYLLYIDYEYDKNNRNDYILCVDDFEKNLHNYSDSKFYKILNNLSDNDKKFLNDYIIYTTIKHKLEKPNIKKKINSIKYDILVPSFIVFCTNYSLGSGIMAFKQNILQHFTAKII
jgi:hypothetical protein